MPDRLARPIVLLILLTLSACGDASPDTQAVAEPPEITLERVAPGLISTDQHETFPAEDPRDGSLWFSRYDDDFDAQTIYRAARTDAGWASPEVASFSGRWGDRAPRFAPDGSTLYFTSNRPTRTGETATTDMNIWMVPRSEDGVWGEPILVPLPVSVEGAPDIHAAVTREGAIYWASRREGGRGRADIYRALLGDAVDEAEHLGAVINDSLSQPDLFVSPDDDWMILVIGDHPEGFGEDDLYLSRRQASGWSAPQNLGNSLNTDAYEYGPALSADGRYLYFNSHRRDGISDVYRVAIEAVGLTPP